MCEWDGECKEKLVSVNAILSRGCKSRCKNIGSSRGVCSRVSQWGFERGVVCAWSTDWSWLFAARADFFDSWTCEWAVCLIFCSARPRASSVYYCSFYWGWWPRAFLQRHLSCRPLLLPSPSLCLSLFSFFLFAFALTFSFFFFRINHFFYLSSFLYFFFEHNNCFLLFFFVPWFVFEINCWDYSCMF